MFIKFSEIIWNIKNWIYDFLSVSWDLITSYLLKLKTCMFFYLFIYFWEKIIKILNKNHNICDWILFECLNFILWFNLTKFLKSSLHFHLNVHLNIYIWCKCYIKTRYHVDFRKKTEYLFIFFNFNFNRAIWFEAIKHELLHCQSKVT